MAAQKGKDRDQDEDQESVEKPAAAGGNKMLIIGLAVAIAVMILAVAAAVFFATRSSHKAADTEQQASTEEPASDSKADHGDKKSAKKHKDAKKPPAQYLDLAPAFVVNMQDDSTIHYLQIEAQVMTRDAKAVEEIKINMPSLRNSLIMLFSQQHPKDLTSAEGKQALQQKSLEAVRKVMQEENGDGEIIEAIYFTNFVMQ